MTYHNSDTITEFAGLNRSYYDGKVRLGKRLNIFDMNSQLRRHLAFRGMKQLNLIAEWDNIIGKIYAEHSIPVAIKNISNVKTLICKVRYTRIIEFQHQKNLFIKQINCFANTELIADIQFVRADKLPIKHKKNIPNGLKIPNEPHPKLSEVAVQCQNEELKKAFHDLAYLIMPIEKQKNTVPQSSIETPSELLAQTVKKNDLLTSWRNRAKNILNCSDK